MRLHLNFAGWFGVILALLFAVMILSGCGAKNYDSDAVLQVIPECTMNPETQKWNSFILEKLPNYRSLDVMLQLANLEALKRTSLWNKEKAENLITWMENQLTTPGLTYADLIGALLPRIEAINELVGEEVYILAQYIPALNQPLAITSCDLVLIKRHLAKQRRVILMATGVPSTAGRVDVDPLK
jgi:hypothetical protein